MLLKVNTIKKNLKIKLLEVNWKKKGYKKAIVTLKKGQSIDLATGV